MRKETWDFVTCLQCRDFPACLHTFSLAQLISWGKVLGWAWLFSSEDKVEGLHYSEGLWMNNRMNSFSGWLICAVGVVLGCHRSTLISALSNTLKDRSPLFYRCRSWGYIKGKQLLTERQSSCPGTRSQGCGTFSYRVPSLGIPGMGLCCALNRVFLTRSRPCGLTHLTRDILGRLGCTVVT